MIPLAPSPSERVIRARSDLRIGLPVVLEDGAVVLAAENIGEERLAALRALGPVELALTARRAQTLKTPVYDGDVTRLAVPDHAASGWITSVADPAGDLRTPMKGPFVPIRSGPPTLARAAIALVKGAHLLPAAVLVPISNAAAFAATHGLTLAPMDAPLPDAADPVAAARLPMALAGAGRLSVLRDRASGEEHYTVEVGTPDPREPVLCRLHSACFTGDVLGSLKCDCGPQLHAALAAMKEPGGVLLYLNQEGRGIGLANKMRAYDLQDQGFDTVEANHRLGFEDDERDFRLGARLLKRMGITRVRLMTNNPRKIALMQANGIDVTERVPLHVGRGPENAAYLDTKAAKSGHMT